MSLALVASGAVAVASFVLEAQTRLAKLYRSELRPHAEQLIIEKRWLERHASSQTQFSRRWRGELHSLYHRQVRRRHRLLFTPADLERALNAEFACITNQEIASWTFLDAVSHSPESFERVVVRCMDRLGWQVSRLAFNRRQGAHLVLSDGCESIAVQLSYTAEEIECRIVQEAAAAALRENCRRACIITNGRFGGAANTLAEAMNVTLLHCSQIDHLVPAMTLVRKEAAAPQLRLAA